MRWPDSKSAAFRPRLTIFPERNLSFLFFFTIQGYQGHWSFLQGENALFKKKELRSYMHEML
jgi:hypothetical protein